MVIQSLNFPSFKAYNHRQFVDALFEGMVTMLSKGCFSLKGGQGFNYGFMWSHHCLMIQNARPEIVDTQLMLNFWTLQRCCRNHFCLERWPIVWLWVIVTAQPLNFPRCDAKSHWRADDAHFEDIAVMLPQPSLPRMAADSLSMS